MPRCWPLCEPKDWKTTARRKAMIGSEPRLTPRPRNESSLGRKPDSKSISRRLPKLKPKPKPTKLPKRARRRTKWARKRKSPIKPPLKKLRQRRRRRLWTLQKRKQPKQRKLLPTRRRKFNPLPPQLTNHAQRKRFRPPAPVAGWPLRVGWRIVKTR